jgi:hypothetical protein
VKLEELGQFKNPVTPFGIESTTFRFVSQFLNQLRHRVPRREVLNKVLVITSEWKAPIGRSRHRWSNDINIVLQCDDVHSIHEAQNNVQLL